MRLVLLTLLCMVIFALNSILCRAALLIFGMDPLLYTAIRGLSAAAMLLVLIARPLKLSQALRDSSWLGALFLFIYMLSFSLSYIGIPSAVGTLVLNSAVQFCMIGWGICQGIMPGLLQVAGISIAFGGLVVLVLPGITAPPLGSCLLMFVSGLAWGAYSLFGLKNASALLSTAGNFIRAIPFGLATLAIALIWGSQASLGGIACALVAGLLASSLGYALWYSVLPHMKLVASSVVQLTIPPITALLGFLILDETIGFRLLIASIAILGGILLVLLNPAAGKRS